MDPICGERPRGEPITVVVSKRFRHMGIRFICDACHKKLNVKSFLAGKRGVCPKCGASIDIPVESTRKSSSGAENREPALARPVATPSTASATVTQATPTPAAVSPTPAAAPMASPAARPAAAPVATPVGNAETPVRAASPAPLTPAPPPAKVDPIAEDPNAVWYVRPPSGGQFGPARGHIMRQWMSEGRVTPDSMVWKEGWADWQDASDIFPELGGTKVSKPAVGIANGASASGKPYQPRRKQGNKTLAVGIVISLTLVSIVLLGILFFVLVSSA